MTGSNTEAVSIPIHLQAVGALLRLTKPFFDKAAKGEQIDPDSLRLWSDLRCTIALILARSSLRLSRAEGMILRLTLDECEPGPDVEFLRGLTYDGTAETAG